MTHSATATFAIGNLVARLTHDTVAALDSTFTKCREDGRTFTLRVWVEETNTPYEFTVEPTTVANFTYNTANTTETQYLSQSAKLLDAIILDGSVVVVVPSD